MSGSDDELDDETEARPLWLRPWVRYAALAAAVGVAYAVTRPKAPRPPDLTTGASAETFIGAVVPYQPPAQAPEPAPQPAPAPAPLPAATPVVYAPTMLPPATPPPAAPPPAPAVRNYLPALPNSVPSRPVSLSYGVPHMDPPKAATAAPAAPERTGLAFKVASLPGVKASPAIDETLMLLPGLLPCVLDTAIKSDLPGPLLCHLPGPVYSPKGVLLMEAGTQVIGKYEQMAKNSGNRLIASSAFAHTPNGVWVPLTGEPLADGLGRNGLDGAVDNHYGERFGASIALNFSDAALGIIQSEVSKGGNTYLQLNSGSGVGGLAQQILQSTINIPPTFSKNQGELIAIFLDQPIDFSDSYKLRTQ